MGRPSSPPLRSLHFTLTTLLPPGHVTGLDQAADVLELARATAAERGVTNIDFATGDVHALDFPDSTFDVVHVHQVSRGNSLLAAGW